MKNLQKLIKKVTDKYTYEFEPPMHGMIWAEKPLSDKAANVVLKEIYRQIIDPQISSRKYKYLINLYCKYLHNSGSMKRIKPIYPLPSDFDGDILNIDTINQDGMIEAVDWCKETIKDKHCTHRFYNGDSSLVDIGDGMCRCELCNIEFHKDIVDDSYSIANQKEINKKINDINLDELLNEEE